MPTFHSERLGGIDNIPSRGIIHNLILGDGPFLYDGVSLGGMDRSSDDPRRVGRSMTRVVSRLMMYCWLMRLMMMMMMVVP